ncbi:MAG: polymer-forming cytoskeletal protein [Ichthyobacteriaceae bacterium]|nr:polymer-forming cytoskeletal protein [Ichthyobacteriaceae bacterium]
MFSKIKEEGKGQVTQSTGNQRNVLAAGTTIVGEIKSDGDFRIDGTVNGTIQTNGRIVVGKTGKIDGTVKCVNAEVEGNISGNLYVKELLSLKNSAVITGDVVVGKLAIEPGATFDATCKMDSSSTITKNETTKQKREKVS